MELARRHFIGEDEIKRMPVVALEDTGSYMHCINEEIQSKMKFSVLEKRPFKMPNGEIEEFAIASFIKLILNDSEIYTDAIILKGNSPVSLGKFTLNKLDKSKTFSSSHHFFQRKIM